MVVHHEKQSFGKIIVDFFPSIKQANPSTEKLSDLVDAKCPGCFTVTRVMNIGFGV